MRSLPFLVAHALWELASYDLVNAVFGFRGIQRHIERSRKPLNPVRVETAVCEAIALAMSLYCKRVKCLQQAVVTARLLSILGGQHAEVVIGYRPAPFFSHAWVEFEGRVINDSGVYQKRLSILARI